VHPFFLPTPTGERFCLYHQPAPDRPARGAILYVHPFAEELNKSRRMAALQARAFAQAGYGVLLIDLHGCGDSGGDFSEARWELWLDDLTQASGWLAQRRLEPLYIWGLRLGALLALDASARIRPQGLVLWQPVLSGRAHLHQFARLHTAALLFGDGGQRDDEIAGYTVAAELQTAIRQADAAAFTPRCPVHWFELKATAMDASLEAQPRLQPASELLIQRWRDDGLTVHARSMPGPAFWASTEISVCEELIAATTPLGNA